MKTKQTARHRDFRLTVQRFAVSGHWQGMAKGLGTVVLTRKHDHDTAEKALRDLRGTLDIHYANDRGVFKGKGRTIYCANLTCPNAARWSLTNNADGTTMHFCDDHCGAADPDARERLSRSYDVRPVDPR